MKLKHLYRYYINQLHLIALTVFAILEFKERVVEFKKEWLGCVGSVLIVSTISSFWRYAGLPHFRVCMIYILAFSCDRRTLKLLQEKCSALVHHINTHRHQEPVYESQRRWRDSCCNAFWVHHKTLNHSCNLSYVTVVEIHILILDACVRLKCFRSSRCLVYNMFILF